MANTINGLLDRLPTSKWGYGGEKPTYSADNTKNSTLHYMYSINGTPKMTNLPTPSTLDLNGVTPSRYLDNPPK